MNNELMDALAIVLDFVERQNKFDDEDTVAEAAGKLEAFAATYQEEEKDL